MIRFDNMQEAAFLRNFSARKGPGNYLRLSELLHFIAVEGREYFRTSYFIHLILEILLKGSCATGMLGGSCLEKLTVFCIFMQCHIRLVF